eukprot:2437482-Rhodomonas_salina.3
MSEPTLSTTCQNQYSHVVNNISEQLVSMPCQNRCHQSRVTTDAGPAWPPNALLCSPRHGAEGFQSAASRGRAWPGLAARWRQRWGFPWSVLGFAIMLGPNSGTHTQNEAKRNERTQKQKAKARQRTSNKQKGKTNKQNRHAHVGSRPW